MILLHVFTVNMMDATLGSLRENATSMGVAGNRRDAERGAWLVVLESS